VFPKSRNVASRERTSSSLAFSWGMGSSAKLMGLAVEQDESAAPSDAQSAAASMKLESKVLGLRMDFSSQSDLTEH